MNFEPLRDMEEFTKDMFNRIIGFQERDHPAWNPALPFAERIAGLPLHYLIFSTPDRDPARFGPTVAHFYPLRTEMRKMAHYARQVAPQPVLCDVHGRNGFIGSLVAREGVRVIGLRDTTLKPNHIENFYDPSCYELRLGTARSIDFAFDVGLSTWMPAGENHTADILRHRPKLMIFVFTQHVDPTTQQRQTGTAEAFDLPAGYSLIDEWSVTRPADLLHEVWPDMTGNIEETRIVRVYANAACPTIAPYVEPLCIPYDWEKDLQMALLGLEAKHTLRRRGVNV